MRKVTKLVLGIESALLTSAFWLWHTFVKIPSKTTIVWIQLSQEAQALLGYTEPYLKVTQIEGKLIFPYQEISLYLIILAEWIAMFFLLYLVIKKPLKKKRRTKRSQKTKSYADWFFKKFPDLK